MMLIIIIIITYTCNILKLGGMNMLVIKLVNDKHKNWYMHMYYITNNWKV